MKRIEIAPGAYVTELDGEKFKRCKIAVHLVVPGSRGNATRLALLPHLLDRSCAAIPDPMQLSRRLFELYGAEIASESYTSGANRVVTIGISGLKNAYAMQGEDLEAEYLNLVGQILFAPKLENGVFSAEEVAIEKEKMADYLRSEMNEKRTYCLQQARRRLFGNSPMGIESSGYLEDVKEIDGENLFSAYKELLSTAQIEAFVVGIAAEKVAAVLRPYLEGIQRAPVAITKPEAVEAAAGFEQYTEPMDTVQGKLCIMCASGKTADTRRFAVMRVASAILGGMATSRLFTNVREKQSLCYYCTSSYAGQSGVLTMDSGVDHANRERAAAAMLHELRRMQEELVEEEELRNALDALATGFTSVNDNLNASENLAFAERMRGSEQTVDELLKLIKSVTCEEVREAMAEFVPVLQYAIVGKGEQA